MADKNNKQKSSGFGAWIKERIRKVLVSLKRNPQIIPIFALTISFLFFSLNLTAISNTTAKIYGKHMGLCAFISMLLSILSYVCMLSAYPKRQKPNIPMIALMLVMYVIIIIADYVYGVRITEALTRVENPIVVTQATFYILQAQYIMRTHIIWIVITMVCVVMEPVFAKLLKKINTSIDVEDNGELENIDISDED